LFVLDPNGVITTWNAGAERITGYSREEIIDQHFSRFYKPEDVEAGKPANELTESRRPCRRRRLAAAKERRVFPGTRCHQRLA
jgi:PAS domain S-box-containing protein